MRAAVRFVVVALAGALLLSCDGCDSRSPEQRAILGVPITDRWDLPTLERAVHVVHVEAGIPHVYAETKRDAWVVMGFLHARDRFVQMELTRRYGQGRIAELIGDAALATDLATRGRGAAEITDRLLSQLSEAEGDLLDAYVEGINAYIAELVRTDAPPRVPIPSELPVVQAFLGISDLGEVLAPFTRRDVVAMLTAVLYNSSFTSDDLNRQTALDGLDGLFDGAPAQALREAGAREDLFDWVRPVRDVPSAAGFGLEGEPLMSAGDEPTGRRVRVPAAVLARAREAGARFDRRRRGMPGADYGSNAWALGPAGTAEGATILAGDGHLPLTVPTLLHQMGIDTRTFGDPSRGPGERQVGLFFPGIPVMPLGTNGNVAFSFTYLYGDLTDWYAEAITLDANGAPASSLFQGEQRPLVAIDDAYDIAEVVALGSVARTETWRRYATFDGRLLASIEGVVVEDGVPAPGPGETMIQVQGTFIIPRDTDMDGVVSAVSFDYTGLDVSNLFRALLAADRAVTVEDFRAAQRSFVGFAQNFVVSDSVGNIYYSGYTATPCRSHLPRVGTGSDVRFADGADPRLLLDGTQYGAFRVELTDNVPDETHADDPARCVVPFDAWPAARNPARGYVLTANNDIGGLAFDGSLANDDYYLGGPWSEGYRAGAIEDALAGHVAGDDGDVASMAALQADHVSRIGRDFVPILDAAIAEAAALTSPSTGEEQRVRDLYVGHQALIDEARARLAAWLTRGANAASGVTTFYDTPTDTDREDAVATMIANAWFRALSDAVFDDEQLEPVLALDPRFMRVTALTRFFAGRGPGNPEDLASYDPTTEESAFFDDRGTTDVESSREIALLALVRALDALAAPTGEAGEDGFGTTDMDAWLWGLRHYLVLDSIITAFAGDVQGIDLIASAVSITPQTLPIVPESELLPNDPRIGLRGYPRPGDWFNVDAANPATSGPSYAYRNGPVMRMVIALDHGRVTGQNVLPQGQSGIAFTPTFDDQVRRWLDNEAFPLRFTAEDVAAGATGREVFR